MVPSRCSTYVYRYSYVVLEVLEISILRSSGVPLQRGSFRPTVTEKTRIKRLVNTDLHRKGSRDRGSSVRSKKDCNMILFKVCTSFQLKMVLVST